MGTLNFENWGSRVNADLKQAFVGNAQWPVDKGALAALIDLGMSDAAIADYFKTEKASVSALRRDYGL